MALIILSRWFLHSRFLTTKVLKSVCKIHVCAKFSSFILLWSRELFGKWRHDLLAKYNAHKADTMQPEFCLLIDKTEIRASISINIYCFIWNVIAHASPKYDGGITKHYELPMEKKVPWNGAVSMRSRAGSWETLSICITLRHNRGAPADMYANALGILIICRFPLA